jgi:hypothetical protein
MLIRISLIVAILAGLAVGVLNFVTIKEKVTALMAERDSERSQKIEAQNERDQTKAQLDQTERDLKVTKQNLETTTAERDRASAEADSQTRRANMLAEDLATTRDDRDAAQAEVAAYRSSGLNPEQVMNAAKQIKGLQDTLSGTQEENKVLGERVTKLDYELRKYRGDIQIVYLPANLSGSIVASDPKWDFVVLNVGEDQGVKTDGELLVNRGGRLVAKVKVTSVQKDRSVANVMPGWKLGEVMEGDQVIPAHPAS